jgi:hypothetical protein
LAKHASFIYRIETDESEANLLVKIQKFLSETKINFRSQHPWKGFLVDEKDRIIFVQIRGYYYSKYGFEIKSVVELFNHERYTNYLQEEVPVLFDIVNKYITINSSASKPRRTVQDALQEHLQDSGFIRIQSIRYEPEFLQWLVHNTKKSKMFTSIRWGKISELSDYDGATTDVAIGTDDQLKDSKVYRNLKDEGKHISIRGFVKIGGKSVKVRIYRNGQITIGADYPDYGFYLMRVVKELDQLREQWAKSNASETR